MELGVYLGASIAECRKRGLLWTRPEPKTRDQIEKERNARLTADSSRVGNAHSHYKPRAKATEEETAKAKQWCADLKDPVAANRRKAAEKADAETAAAYEQRQLMELFRDPSVEFADYTPEQLAAFKKLTPANMRLIGARRDDYKRGKAQEAAAARRKSQ
jgi:hypothetical protein